jgi:hypothetical protein
VKFPARFLGAPMGAPVLTGKMPVILDRSKPCGISSHETRSHRRIMRPR